VRGSERAGAQVREHVVPKIAPTLAELHAGQVESLDRALGDAEQVGHLIAKMGRRDHTDLLVELQKAAAINRELVEVWANWRHIMAHGDREAQRELPRLYRVCDAHITLLYQLYFHAIGYQGIYSYFALPGWPVRHYPDVHPEISIPW
jgi:hypothetical protein